MNLYPFFLSGFAINMATESRVLCWAYGQRIRDAVIVSRYRRTPKGKKETNRRYWRDRFGYTENEGG